MRTLHQIKFVSLCLFLCAAFIPVSQASETPESVINTLHDALIGVMKESKEIGYEGRYHELKPVINNSFDFKTIARVVLSRYWKKLDESQQAEFIETFGKLSVAVYASRFDGFSGQSFKYLDKKELKNDRILVETQFLTEERTVAFNYVLHSVEGQWRIINVVVDGVSDLSLKRADYTTIMKADGFETLLNKLKEKIEQAAGKNPD